jgi:hypothetical protein
MRVYYFETTLTTDDNRSHVVWSKTATADWEIASSFHAKGVEKFIASEEGRPFRDFDKIQQLNVLWRKLGD